MEKTITTVNGVELPRLKETINAVKNQPEIGRFKFKATNEWIDGGHNRSLVKNFYGACQEDTSRMESFELVNDEPDVLLGQDNGANPVEHLLHALAGCLTTSMVYHAAARGYQLDRVDSTLEGDLDLRGFLGIDPTVRNGYSNVKVQFNIEGDLTQEQKSEILKMGPAFSPVFDVLSNGTRVDVSLSVN